MGLSNMKDELHGRLFGAMERWFDLKGQGMTKHELVPLPGSLLIAKVIESVAIMTRLPPASCTWTLMAGEMAVVDTALVGSTL